MPCLFLDLTNKFIDFLKNKLFDSFDFVLKYEVKVKDIGYGRTIF